MIDYRRQPFGRTDGKAASWRRRGVRLLCAQILASVTGMGFGHRVSRVSGSGHGRAAVAMILAEMTIALAEETSQVESSRVA